MLDKLRVFFGPHAHSVTRRAKCYVLESLGRLRAEPTTSEHDAANHLRSISFATPRATLNPKLSLEPRLLEAAASVNQLTNTVSFTRRKSDQASCCS